MLGRCGKEEVVWEGGGMGRRRWLKVGEGLWSTENVRTVKKCSENVESENGKRIIVVPL